MNLSKRWIDLKTLDYSENAGAFVLDQIRMSREQFITETGDAPSILEIRCLIKLPADPIDALVSLAKKQIKDE